MKKKNLLLIAAFAIVIVVVIVLPKGNKNGAGGPGMPAKSGDTVFRITSVEATRADLQSYIETNGDVEADNTVDVYPDIAGKLVTLRAHLGTKVSKGEAIADIDPSKPGASYALSPVYAPISGTLTSVPQKIGATVSTGTSIAQIGDIGNLQVSAKIPERDVAVLKTGLRAIVTFEAYPGVEFPVHVFRVSPLVDSTSRTKEIYLSFDAEDTRINAGMFAKIKLFTTVSKGCVTVPEESIVTNYEKQYVYAVNGDSTVTKREVKIGTTVDGVTEILSGLKVGEKIANQGVTSLSDGVKVKDISTKAETSSGGAQ
jgi:RND family efflux transporter, MFP subunit